MSPERSQMSPGTELRGGGKPGCSSLFPFPCVVAKGRGFVKGTVVLDSFHKGSRPQFPSRIQIRMKNSIKSPSFEEEPLSTCNWQCLDSLDNVFHKECWVMLSDTISFQYAPYKVSLCGSKETKCGDLMLRGC